jgi:hypothetical protein
MNTPYKSLIFNSPLAFDEAKQRLDESVNLNKKRSFNKMSQIVIQTTPLEGDRVEFSMIMPMGKRGLLQSTVIHNTQQALKTGEKRFGKVKGTLQGRPDGTTLVECQFYWRWWQAFMFIVNPLVLGILFGIALGLMLLTGSTLFLYFFGFMGVAIILSLLFLFIKQAWVWMRFTRIVKQTLGYQGLYATLKANNNSNQDINPPITF